MLWWLLTHEMYLDRGGDPLAIYETGKVPTARSLAMLKPLSDEEVRSLFAYLQSTKQVPLPKGFTK